MRKYIISIILAAASCFTVFAQHEVAPSLSSQIFSRINFNPAGMGNSESLNIFSQSRMQWIGFGDGAPKSTILNIHYFHENWKSGFGGTMTYDQIGFGNRSITAKLAYMYNLDLSEKGLISFGLGAGINQFSKDYSDDKYDQTLDMLGVIDNESKINPDIDFGIEYSMPYFMIGASISHIGMMDDITTLKPTQTYYGYARGYIPFNEQWQLAPTVLYMNSGRSNVLDAGAVVFYQGLDIEHFLLWGGTNVNCNFFTAAPGVAVMIGMEYNWFRVGYAYEASFGVKNYNSHDLILGFNIKTKKEYSYASNKKRRK
ncbi:MAG: PorP/SprF family type IX secretion system membrane protein [Paludibacteraceae bacterium]|nr:PorP/SprF family type IX secretion system membrane protein [Paludibacteraceae bacterium]